MNNKKIIKPTSFPNHLAPDEEKIKDEFGLQVAQTIQYEWFNRGSDGNCDYYDKRTRYHELRLYARGEQDTKLYKNMLTDGDESSYTNYDFRPIQVVPKFVNLIVNQMTERLFDIKAEATDKFSTDMKDKYRKSLESFITTKPILQKAKDVLGVDMFPKNMDEQPQTMEEVDLHMQLNYKTAVEIATQEAIKYTLALNDYNESQRDVVEDITVIGLGFLKHKTDPTKGITVERVDPANMVYSYPTHKNFKNVHYYGEVRKITIHELKRIANRTFTDKEIEEIGKATMDWSGYHGDSNEGSNNNEDMEGMMVNILDFTFKSTKTISYKKKYTSNGGYKMIKKESTFDKKNKDYTGFDASKKVIDVWYEGSLILGTDKLFNYKLCENMIRPKGHLNKAIPNYIAYAPELYQNRTKSLVERIIPYVDQMQQIHIKLQQTIAKARPNGIYIDVDGIEQISLGDGNFLTPMELIKIYDETGNVLGSSKTMEGEYNHGREPIRELKNGIIDGLDRLIMAYNHYQNLLRDAIGIPQGADASTPHPDMAVGVQNNLAATSNVATRHILDAILNMSESLGEGLSLRLKDIFEYSDLKEVYLNAIGKMNVKVLESLNDYHLHDVGVMIELKPDTIEKQMLEQNIQQGLQQGLITVDDAIDIRSISNIKLANQLIKVRRTKRELEKKQHEEKIATINQEGQQKSTQIATQAKQQEIQMKGQLELQIIQAKSQADIMRLQAEKELKSGLMQQEFEYNMAIKGIDTENLILGEKYKEDRKDNRQTKNNTQASKLIEQRQYDLPAVNFESSEDNLSGSIEMGELEPS